MSNGYNTNYGSHPGRLSDGGFRRDGGARHVFNPNAAVFVPGRVGRANNDFGSGQPFGSNNGGAGIPANSGQLLFMVSSTSSVSRGTQTIVTDDMIDKTVGTVYVGGPDVDEFVVEPPTAKVSDFRSGAMAQRNYNPDRSLHKAFNTNASYGVTGTISNVSRNGNESSKNLLKVDASGTTAGTVGEPNSGDYRLTGVPSTMAVIERESYHEAYPPLSPLVQESKPTHQNVSARRTSKKKSKDQALEVNQLCSKLEIEPRNLSDTDDQGNLKSGPAHGTSSTFAQKPLQNLSEKSIGTETTLQKAENYSSNGVLAENTDGNNVYENSKAPRANLPTVPTAVADMKAKIPSGVISGAISETETAGNAGNVSKASSESVTTAAPAIKKDEIHLVKVDIDKKSVTSSTKVGDNKGSLRISTPIPTLPSEAMDPELTKDGNSEKAVDNTPPSQELLRDTSTAGQDKTPPKEDSDTQKTEENHQSQESTKPSVQEEKQAPLTRTARKRAKKIAKAELIKMGNPPESVNDIKTPSSKKVRNRPEPLHRFSSGLTQVLLQKPLNKKIVDLPPGNNGNASKTVSVALSEPSLGNVPTIPPPNAWAARKEAIQSLELEHDAKTEDLGSTLFNQSEYPTLDRFHQKNAPKKWPSAQKSASKTDSSDRAEEKVPVKLPTAQENTSKTASESIPSVKPQETAPKKFPSTQEAILKSTSSKLDSNEQDQEKVPKMDPKKPSQTFDFNLSQLSSSQPTNTPQPQKPPIEKNQMKGKSPMDKSRRTDPKRTPIGKRKMFRKGPVKVRTVDENGWITVTTQVPIEKPKRKATKKGPKKPSEKLELDFSQLSGTQPNNQVPLPLLQTSRPAPLQPEPEKNAENRRRDIEEDHVNLENSSSEEDTDVEETEKRGTTLNKVPVCHRSKVQKKTKKRVPVRRDLIVTEEESELLEECIKKNEDLKRKEEETSKEIEPGVVAEEEPSEVPKMQSKKVEKPVEKNQKLEISKNALEEMIKRKIQSLETVASPPTSPPIDLQELREDYNKCLKELVDLLTKRKKTWVADLVTLPKESRGATKKRDDKMLRFLRSRIEELRKWKNAQQVTVQYEALSANYSSVLGPTIEKLARLVPKPTKSRDPAVSGAIETQKTMLHFAETAVLDPIFVREEVRKPYTVQ